jgi:hypothetical protein
MLYEMAHKNTVPPSCMVPLKKIKHISLEDMQPLSQADVHKVRIAFNAVAATFARAEKLQELPPAATEIKNLAPWREIVNVSRPSPFQLIFRWEIMPSGLFMRLVLQFSGRSPSG